MYEIVKNKLYYCRKPEHPRVLVSEGVPKTITDPDEAAQWAEGDGYENLMRMADEYGRKAKSSDDLYTHSVYRSLEYETRIRAELSEY